MAKLKKAVKPTVKAKRGRGRPTTNKQPTNKVAVHAKGAKSLKGRLKAKKGPFKLSSPKSIARKNTAKSGKRKATVNKRKGRSASTKATPSNKTRLVTEKKAANA